MSAQDKLKKQILGQNLTGKWSGAGHGSSEANAEDMAKILSGIGITDIKQFGKVAKYDPVQEAYKSYNGYRVTKTLPDENGQGGGDYVYTKPTNRTDNEGGVIYETLMVPKGEKLKTHYGFYRDLGEAGHDYIPVDSSKVVDRNGVLFGDTGTTTFGNKETGKEVPTTYHGQQYQNGNFFGGTYAGKGNTGYGVQFDAQGNPIFYTQGASSSDIGQLAPFLALASFVPGLQPFAMAANAAIAADQGNPLGVIASLAGMGNLAGISGMADVANAAKFAGALKSGDPLAIAMAGANAGGVDLGSTDIGGISLGDIGKGIGAIKAIDSGNPLALLPYLNSVLPKDGGLTSSIGSGGEGYVEPTFQDTTGLDEGPIIPVNEAPAPDVIDQLLNSGMPSPDEDFMPTLPTPTETKPEEETDWNALYNTGLSPEEIAKREALMESLPNQELQIDPENWESFDKNLSDIMTNKGGYTSQWQTVGNDRVMLDDQGTGIGINTETGESYALDEDQVNSMIKNGMLNTAASGYVAATGGTGDRPGGSGPAPAAPAKPTAPAKPVAPVKPTAPTKPGAPTPTGTATATPTALNAPQQTSNADLLNLLGSKPELANIKSFKELFGEDLFGGKYVPPSAGGDQSGGFANYGRGDESSTSSQNDGVEQLFRGGRVDDFDVNALLQILRS